MIAAGKGSNDSEGDGGDGGTLTICGGFANGCSMIDAGGDAIFQGGDSMVGNGGSFLVSSGFSSKGISGKTLIESSPSGPKVCLVMHPSPLDIHKLVALA